jgi:hypothetical protein
MIHEANLSELKLIDKVVSLSQSEFTLVRITETMLNKSTIDANRTIVELMDQSNYFDFALAEDGVKNYLPIKILGEEGWIDSITRIPTTTFRPASFRQYDPANIFTSVLRTFLKQSNSLTKSFSLYLKHRLLESIEISTRL